MHGNYTFPKGFLWGTATSAFQTEGNNTNTDWWEWENRNKKAGDYPKEPSGIACDSYNRYEEDFDLCKQMNNNVVRISVEWARIEPEEGKYDAKEFEHYKGVLLAARSRGLKVFLTLHHFTNPIWFSKKGGWLNPKAAYYFAGYSKKCAEEFGGLADVFLTINEPQVYALMSFVRGIWPPQKKSLFLSLIVQINMIRAHKKAYNAIKSVGNYTVGIVKNIVWYEPTPEKKFLDVLTAKFLYFLNCDLFLKPILNSLDVIGLNYYFTSVFHNFKECTPTTPASDLKWWINALGLKNILSDLKRFNKPVYITENGLADSGDSLRKNFIYVMLLACYNAINEGTDLKGYFHWSLLDNYEWHEGFWPRFGLVEVERNNNLKRTPRPSFYYYSEICKDGILRE